MFLRRKYVLSYLTFMILLFLILFQIAFKHFRIAFLNMDYIFDIELINDMASDIGFDVYIIDKNLLSSLSRNPYDFDKIYSLESHVVLGIDAKFLDKLQLMQNYKNPRVNNMDIEIFYNEKPRLQNDGFKLNSPIAFVLQKNYCYIFHILHSREDNTWWYGNLASDVNCSSKLKNILLQSLYCYSSELHENILNRFQFTMFTGFHHPLSRILVPKDQNIFISQSRNSNFLECNYSRAELFKNTYTQSHGSNALRFKHKAWKLLSKTKTILDLLSISFWISSGTCLGFFRECDIIPYSKDVDIGIFAKDYNQAIISNMEANGLILKHWFGQNNDSLELSFIGEGGVKLDIFFFYIEEDHFWNGGTQLKTGKKFKYIFPKFNLCWTLFCGLKVRIPCETESYIVANYGNDWFSPIYKWDWKTSPHNVVANGYWHTSFHKSHLLKVGKFKCNVECKWRIFPDDGENGFSVNNIGYSKIEEAIYPENKDLVYPGIDDSSYCYKIDNKTPQNKDKGNNPEAALATIDGLTTLTTAALTTNMFLQLPPKEAKDNQLYPEENYPHQSSRITLSTEDDSSKLICAEQKPIQKH